MNLQHAKNNPGKFHTMRAHAIKFDEKQGDYGPYALGSIKDELGTMENVLFAVKQGETLVDATTAKQLCIWGVKYDANNGKFKAYFNDVVAKQLQGSPQSPQNEPESTNTPGTGNNVYIRTDLVCAYISSGKKPLAEDIEYWIKYCKTGIDASLPGNKPMENQPEDRRARDEDVPY